MFAKFLMPSGMGPSSLVLRPMGVRPSLPKFNSLFFINPGLRLNSIWDCGGFQLWFWTISVKNTTTAITLFKSPSLCSIFLRKGRINQTILSCLWNKNNVSKKFSMQKLKVRVHIKNNNKCILNKFQHWTIHFCLYSLLLLLLLLMFTLHGMSHCALYHTLYCHK